MREYSSLFNIAYDTEEVWYISNMQQNYKYLNSPKANGNLVDIICGQQNRVVFVWKRTPEIKQLYDLWCNNEL